MRRVKSISAAVFSLLLALNCAFAPVTAEENPTEGAAEETREPVSSGTEEIPEAESSADPVSEEEESAAEAPQADGASEEAADDGEASVTDGDAEEEAPAEAEEEKEPEEEESAAEGESLLEAEESPALSESPEEGSDDWIREKEDEIIAEVIRADMSDYEKLEALAKYIADHYKLGKGNSEYSLLKDGSGSGQAAADMICSIAGRLGIPSVINEAYEHNGAIYHDAISKTSDGKYVITDASIPVTSEIRTYALSYPGPFLYDTVRTDGETKTRILRSLYFAEEEIHIPETYPEEDPHPVEEIGADVGQEGSYFNAVFKQNTGLRRLYLPKTVRRLSRESLLGKFQVIVDENNPYFRSDGDFLLSKDGKTLYRYPENGTSTVIIPAGVEHLAVGLLFKNPYVKRVEIPEGVTTIGPYVLYNCNALEDVILPSTLTKIETSALTYASRANYWVYSKDAVIESDCFAWAANVIGYPGSTAETYAKTNGLSFKDITNPFPAEAVSFAHASMVIGSGDSTKLTPEFTPYYATYVTLTWKSTDSSIVSVDENGVITGRKTGKAVVSVTTESGIRGSIEITVKDSVEVREIRLSPSPMHLALGTKTALAAEILPAEAAYHPLTWTSDDPSVASVSEAGVVTGNKLGSTYVHAAVQSGKSASVKVTVTEYIPVESVAFKNKTFPMHVNDRKDLGLVVEPADASVSDLVYAWTNLDGENEDKDAFTIAGTSIQANREGHYYFSASSSSGKKAEMFVYVSDSPYRVVPETDYLCVSAGTKTKLNAAVTDSSGTPVSQSPYFMGLDEDRIAVLYTDGTLQANKPGTLEVWIYVKGEYVSDKRDLNNFAVMTIKIGEGLKSLSLDVHSLDLSIGESRPLTVTTAPADADKRQLKWSSDHPEIVSVDENGKATAKAVGSAKITVSASAGTKTLSDTCTVQVSSRIEQLSLPSSLEIHPGEHGILTPVILPEGAAGELAYSSENPEVLLVSDAGLLTPLKTGTSTITVRVRNNPSISASCAVSVTEIPAASISLNLSSFETAIGRTRQLHAVIGPENVTDPCVTYTSLHPDIASVSENGLVTGLAEGSADIEAKTANGLTAVSHVKVCRDEIKAELLLPENGFVYTGTAVKPTVSVYDGGRKLAEKTDYTVSYRDNKNAGQASAVITMKGSYASSHTLFFDIRPIRLEDEAITVLAPSLTFNPRKSLKPSLTVTYSGKKLKENTDYRLTSDRPLTEAGSYEFTVTGIGNYAGERKLAVTVADPEKTNVSKLKVTSKAVSYEPGMDFQTVLDHCELTVKAKQPLDEGLDYELKNPQNCTQAGTCTFELHGLGDYSGERIVSVKISGTPISKPKVKVNAVLFDGRLKTLEDAGFVLTGTTGDLEAGKDYRILEETYENNRNAGTASVTVQGIGAYTGMRKVNFKISPNPALIAEEDIVVEDVPYAKGGAMPKVRIDGLAEGQDFKVTYKNNRNAGTAAAQITLLGNYKSARAIPISFTVSPQDIANVYAYAKDVTAGTKKGGYVSAPVLTDLDGKTLKAGTDYEKPTQYYRVDAYGIRTLLDPKKDTAEPGMVIDVKIIAKEGRNYKGTCYVRYHVYDKAMDLSKADVRLSKPEYEYTGEPIEPKADELIVKMKGSEQQLEEGTDYRIVSIVNNVRKGTAKLTLQGIGTYGGVKTVSFKIVERNKTKDHWLPS